MPRRASGDVPGGEPRATVLYDGECALCRRAVNVLLRSPPEGVAVRSFRDHGVLAAFPAVDAARAEEALQLVRSDGTVCEGADAVVELVRHRWWARPLVAAHRLPPLRRLMSSVYGAIARSRHRLGGRGRRAHDKR